MPKEIRMEAPDDVFVDQVLVRAGPVTVDQKLLILRSPKIDRLLARSAAFQSQIEIAERPFHDGRLDEEIQALVQKSQYLKSAVDWTKEALTYAQQQFTIGQITLVDRDGAQLRVQRADSAYTDAKLAADHAPKKQQDMLDKLASMKEALRNHQTFLETMKSSLTITSPLAGDLQLFVGPNCFVKKGHSLGVIEL